MQPRQIYASTAKRRERRWTSRPARDQRLTPLLMACVLAALTVLAAVAPTLI